jgi:hypothetical protein
VPVEAIVLDHLDIRPRRQDLGQKTWVAGGLGETLGAPDMDERRREVQ